MNLQLLDDNKLKETARKRAESLVEDFIEKRPQPSFEPFVLIPSWQKFTPMEQQFVVNEFFITTQTLNKFIRIYDSTEELSFKIMPSFLLNPNQIQEIDNDKNASHIHYLIRYLVKMIVKDMQMQEAMFTHQLENSGCEFYDFIEYFIYQNAKTINTKTMAGGIIQTITIDMSKNSIIPSQKQITNDSPVASHNSETVSNLLICRLLNQYDNIKLDGSIGTTEIKITQQ